MNSEKKSQESNIKSENKKPNLIKQLMRLPFSMADNISRILKFSIRTKISFNYIALFAIIVFMTLLIAVSGYLYYVRDMVSNENQSNFERITVAMDTFEKNGDLGQLAIEINIIRAAGRNSETAILVMNKDGKTIASTESTYPINNYSFIRASNPIYNNFSFFSILSYGLMPAEFEYGEYRIVFFDDIWDQLSNLGVFILLMTISLLIGFFMIWFLGGMSLKRVLSPINKITKTAQQINTQNLDMRIDVGESKYELRDLSLTINAMIDRIQDGYGKQQRFVSDVSHELRTPISVIHGYANMLDRWGKKDPEVLQESIDALKHESANMADLVEKLLFLARHDGDTLKYEMSRLNLSELVEDIIKETEMIDSTHPFESRTMKDIYINGDVNRIKQMIRIFVDNAIKYTPEGKAISIKIFAEDNWAVVEIKDQGIGISEKDMNNIFERFFRADESRTRTTGGYGLGLSISKIIVLQHGGKIKVRSKPGAGSIFSVYLPVDPEHS